jgi:hypothetical protein
MAAGPSAKGPHCGDAPMRWQLYGYGVNWTALPLAFCIVRARRTTWHMGDWHHLGMCRNYASMAPRASLRCQSAIARELWPHAHPSR